MISKRTRSAARPGRRLLAGGWLAAGERGKSALNRGRNRGNFCSVEIAESAAVSPEIEWEGGSGRLDGYVWKSGNQVRVVEGRVREFYAV